MSAGTQNRIISGLPQNEDICAIIVTYRPDAVFQDRFEVIASQVGSMVIVDNCSDPSTLDVLRRMSLRSNIHLISNDANLGVATALNRGILHAKNLGYKWVLTFDQDTAPEREMVRALLDIYRDFSDRDKIAVIGANYSGADCQKSQSQIAAYGCGWLEKRTVITSGSLMPVAAFDSIGNFRDEFFIDHVDSDYCLRARSKGFKVILALKPLMRHTIGCISVHRLLGKRTSTTNHSPVRRFYMTRNLIILARERLLTEPRWVIGTLGAWLKSTVFMCLFERERLSKLKSVAAGVLAGLSFH